MNSGRVWKCPTCGRTRPGAMATTSGPICRYDLSEMKLVMIAGGFGGPPRGAFGGGGNRAPRRNGAQAFLDSPRPQRDPNRDPNRKPPGRRRQDERPAAPPGAPPDPIDEAEGTATLPDAQADERARNRRNRRGRRRGRRPDGEPDSQPPTNESGDSPSTNEGDSTE